MIYLVFIFISNFPWYPISEDYIYGNLNELIQNSGEISAIVQQYGGEEYLIKGFIHLYGNIFKGGEMVLLPKGYKVTKVPENLKLIKRNIDMKKYNRFTALYKEGELIGEWNELARESEDKLGISSIESLSMDELSILFPRKILPQKEEIERIGTIELHTEEVEFSEEEEDDEIKYPRKNYLSFILVDDGWVERLFPVILHLYPVDERIKELQSMDE